MPDLLHWIGGGIALAGVMISILGAVGVLRFPDVYTRIHAASITDTGGATLALLGLCLVAGLSAVTVKLVIAWLLILLTTPAAANALANAAFSSGHHPRIGNFQLMRTDDRRKTPRGGDGQ